MRTRSAMRDLLRLRDIEQADFAPSARVSFEMAANQLGMSAVVMPW